MSTATRTEAQRQASRQNGRKSQGPTSEPGKAASRRNALRHGLTAQHPDHLPAGLAASLQSEIEVYRRHFNPRDDRERQLVDQAAFANLQWFRLAHALEQRAAHHARHAIERWDSARAAEVARLADRFTSGPLSPPPTNLKTTLNRLHRTAEGCDWLADAWDGLLNALDYQPAWTDRQSQLAARLLGRPHFTASPDDLHELDPETRASWLDLQSNVEATRQPSTPPDIAAAARQSLRELCEELRDELLEIADTLWNSKDAPDRASAPTRAFFDTTPEGSRLVRYLNDAERTARRALNELERLRSQPAPPRAAVPQKPHNRAVPTPKPQSQPAPKTNPTPPPKPAPANPWSDLDLDDDHDSDAAFSYVPIAITPPHPRR